MKDNKNLDKLKDMFCKQLENSGGIIVFHPNKKPLHIDASKKNTIH